MQSAAAEQRVGDDCALEVVTDDVLFRHADTAMELNALGANISGRIRDEGFRG